MDMPSRLSRQNARQLRTHLLGKAAAMRALRSLRGSFTRGCPSAYSRSNANTHTCTVTCMHTGFSVCLLPPHAYGRSIGKHAHVHHHLHAQWVKRLFTPIHADSRPGSTLQDLVAEHNTQSACSAWPGSHLPLHTARGVWAQRWLHPDPTCLPSCQQVASKTLGLLARAMTGTCQSFLLLRHVADPLHTCSDSAQHMMW